MKIPKLGFIEKISTALFLLFLITVLLLAINFKQIEKAGAFGDALNGLLTPIISLFGAVLVYKTFKEQIRANNLLQAQWSFDLYLRIFNDIKNNFESISIRISTVGIAEIPRTAKGLDAFYNLHYKNSNIYDVSGDWEAFRDLEPVVIEFLRLKDRLERSTIEEQDYLRSKLLNFYESDLGKASKVVLEYFEKNPNRVKTKEENALLITKLKELEVKMKR